MAHVSITPIRRILVANRGEIACRIMRTARDMGIETVAIYADSDANSPFVRDADTAVALNGRTSRQTYLDLDKVVNAARLSGADAVHPGYGFLSENADFARAVVDAGMSWIGPPPEAIDQMGDKLAAKRLMQSADVPTLPAVELTEAVDPNAAALDIGYPVLVKASAGGGGRGMRIVEREDDLNAAIAGARREAGSAFGDDTLFLEKWLPSTRHVEVQILGDRHGNLLHCFERECSIQRRHQKIIEEAPSPALSPALRERMGAAALAAARELDYASAGTVEFLVSGDDFWFLEVNTRLQVEHPVTEAIIGHDLVREQIRVAEGEPLSFSQDDLTITGHAIEARLYAEDPTRNFLPSPGTVVVWRPSTVGQARFDAGVESGTHIGTEFDPMIAKVIVHAPTRREAASRLARVLETTNVQGLTTNRDFLVATLRTSEFLAGDTTTDFIERVQPDRERRLDERGRREAAIATCIAALTARRAGARVLRHIPSSWRNSHMPPERTTFTYGDEAIDVAYRRTRDGGFEFDVGDTRADARLVDATGTEFVVDIDGRRLTFSVTRHAPAWFVHGPQGSATLVEAPRYPAADATDAGGGLLAPMPGSVLATEVSDGDAVTKGQLLLILEAMKMEHRITAPRDGVVERLHVAAGDQVDNGQLMVTLADEESQ